MTSLKVVIKVAFTGGCLQFQKEGEEEVTFLFDIFSALILQKAFQSLFMIRVQRYYVIVCLMRFCIPVGTAKRPCELTHPKHSIFLLAKFLACSLWKYVIFAII